MAKGCQKLLRLNMRLCLKSAWLADMPTLPIQEAQSAVQARNSSSQVSMNDVSGTERGLSAKPRSLQQPAFMNE